MEMSNNANGDSKSEINDAPNSSAGAGKEIDYDAASKGLSWGGYLKFRCQNSNTMKYYSGEGLTSDEADTVINTMALVAALVLTIPFGAALSFNIEYWDEVQSLLPTCNTGKTFLDIYDLIAHSLYAVAYSSMAALAVCIFYYMLRPSGPYFQVWWRHGKYAVLLAFLCVLVAIVSMMTLFGSFMGWYVNSTQHYCTIQDRNKSSYGTGIFFLVLSVLLSLFWMF
mmetsp:Transcript_21633/g.36230  ORF Transcript_21633/g.36230 Transcript_21633/m.36230 type:complete len:225 (-) Transcript_21633:386-1060(-)